MNNKKFHIGMLNPLRVKYGLSFIMKDNILEIYGEYIL